MAQPFVNVKGDGTSHTAKLMAKALSGKVKVGLRPPGQSGGPGEQKAAPFIKSKTQAHKDSDSDLSGFSDDDGDEMLEQMREQRMRTMKKRFERAKEFRALGHGEYSEIVEEEFLPTVTKSKYCICHWYHRDFERCKIVDKHLAMLAPKYLPTKFVKINADKAPFFVGKLQVRTLPTVVLFKDGVAVGRIVGFGELGGVDDFKTEVLEKRIMQSGVIAPPSEEDEDRSNEREHERVSSIRKSNLSNKVSEEDWD